MTMTSIDEMMHRARLADGKPMSDERLREVFDLVKPRSNWKNAIDARVPRSAASPQELQAAVTWFTGGLASVTGDGTHFHVIAAGYYADIGG